MRMYDLIRKKRDGGEMTAEEIKSLVEGVVEGSIPDYQISAWLMAVYFNGMTEHETACLTQSMAESGDVADLSFFGNNTVDKHSTGGVGDKTTLIVAPIAAAAGCTVCKMSGRGLGHTGGTVDKLESIPGYRTEMPAAEFLKQTENIGIAVIGQTGNLAPADKKLYALRDVTATVDSIPLITASVMSKKIAAGSKNIVLDVKCGSGAFMKNADDAQKLAAAMVEIGNRCGRNTAAVITNMDVPLGRAVGNSLEVAEAADILKNGTECDLKEVSLVLAAHMIALTKGVSAETGRSIAEEMLSSGAAYAKMKEWIAAQGGDTACLDDTALLPGAKEAAGIVSMQSGYITQMDCEGIGSAAMLLGAGRVAKDDVIDPAAGIIINKKTEDRVEKGDVLCTLYTNRPDTLKAATERYMVSVTFGETQPQTQPLIYKTVK